MSSGSSSFNEEALIMTEKSRATTLSQKNRVTHKARAQTEARNPRNTVKESRTPAPRRRPRSAAAAIPDVQTRQRMIADAAYYKAERRGFAAGDPDGPLRDWLEAEAEIDRYIKTFGVTG
jgi:hypothetical protein